MFVANEAIAATVSAAEAFDVSVVVPLHNKARFIIRTLDTVLDQSLPPREVIIVDDGSTDGGAETVAARFGSAIKLVRQANTGPGPARNRGMAEARGAWIALIDGDDRWRPDHLATLAGVARAFPTADVLATGYRRVAADRAEHNATPSFRAAAAEVRLLDLFATPTAQSPLCSSAIALRRGIEAGGNGFGAFWPGEDFEYWARLALDHDIAFTTHVTTTYLQETDGLMEQHERAGGGGGELQGIFATLDAALVNPAYAARHPAICAYRIALLRQNMRQALFRCAPRDARRFAAELRARGATPDVLANFLSRCPTAMLRAGKRIRAVIAR